MKDAENGVSTHSDRKKDIRSWWKPDDYYPFEDDVIVGVRAELRADDDILKSALEALADGMKDNDKKGDSSAEKEMLPLDDLIFKRVLAHVMLHRNDIEDALWQLEQDGKEMTLEQWETTWRTVGEKSAASDSKSAANKYPKDRFVDMWFQRLRILSLDDNTGLVANKIARMERDRYMAEVFHLINESEDGSSVDDKLTLDEWKTFLHPELDRGNFDGTERVRNYRAAVAEELMSQQVKACSIELAHDRLKKLLHEILERTDTVEDEISATIRGKQCTWKTGRPFQVTGAAKTPQTPSELERAVAFRLSVGNAHQISFGLSRDDAVFKDLRGIVLGKEKDSEEEDRAPFGGDEDILVQLQADMIRMSRCIVSEDAWKKFNTRLEKRCTQLNISEAVPYLLELVESYRISETVFCDSYEKATKVSITGREKGLCAASSDLWDFLVHEFNGEIDKKVFLTNCAKKPTQPAEGLGYHIGFAKRRYELVMRDVFFLFFFAFTMLLTFFLQSDKGITSSHYLNVAVEESVGKDEVGDKDSYWFSQSYYDAVNEDEYWDWFKGPLLETMFDSESGSPGSLTSLHHTNKLVGGIKVRQFRSKPKNCKGLEELFEQRRDSCHGDGDPRKSTGWDQVSSSQPLTPPTQQQQNDDARADQRCFSGSPKRDASDYNRTVTVAYPPNNDAAAAIASTLAYLLDEQLGIFPALTTVPSVDDAVLGYDVAVGYTNETVGYSPNAWSALLYPSARDGFFMTKTAAEACAACVNKGSPAFKDNEVAALFDNTVYSRIGVDLTQKVVALGWDGKMNNVQLSDSVFVETVTASAENGRNVLFFDSYPSVLIAQAEGVRLALDEAEEYPESIGIKLVQSGVRTEHPDAWQLLYYYALNAKQLGELLAADSPCSWLTSSKWAWDSWIRRSVEADLKRREQTYYQGCYDSWDLGDDEDKESFLHSQYLSPGRGTFEELTPKKIYNIDDSGELTDEVAFEAPTREEFFGQMDRANSGNMTAQTLWEGMQPWVYRTCSELGGTQYIAYPGLTVASQQVKTSYGCSGYGTIIPVSSTYAQAAAVADKLKANQWIDGATRGVMVEFFIHNQNSRVISRFRYLVEMTTTGGWEPSMQVHSFRLFQMESLARPFWWVAAVVIVISLFGILVFEFYRSFMIEWRERLVELRAEADKGHGNICPLFSFKDGEFNVIGLKLVLPCMALYFSNILYVYDTLLYSLVAVSWVLRFWYISMGLTGENVSCTEVYPNDYETAADVSYIVFQMDGIVILLAYLRLTIYLRSFQEIHRILLTVRRAALLIFYLLIIFLIFMVGFTLSAWVVFGTLIRRYRGISDSFGTLLFMMMGQFDFNLMNDARPGFALTFFLLFYIIVVTILFNLLIGVISTAFDEVYSEKFDEETFRARVLHDPASGAWDGDRAFGIKVAITENPGMREFLYLWRLFTYPFRVCCGVGAEKLDPNFANSNPRLFWPAYLEVLQDLDSPDLHLVFRANAVLKILAKKYGASLDLESADEKSATTEKMGSYELAAIPVRTFIDENIGKARRPLLHVLLVELPCRILAFNKTRSWYTVLTDHTEWKLEVERWADFHLSDEEAGIVTDLSRGVEDSLKDLRNEMDELQNNIDRLTRL